MLLFLLSHISTLYIATAIYHCDEKWNPNHKCMKRRVYVIEEIEEGGVEVESDSEEYDEVIEVEDT